MLVLPDSWESAGTLSPPNLQQLVMSVIKAKTHNEFMGRKDGELFPAVSCFFPPNDRFQLILNGSPNGKEEVEAISGVHFSDSLQWNWRTAWEKEVLFNPVERNIVFKAMFGRRRRPLFSLHTRRRQTACGLLACWQHCGTCWAVRLMGNLSSGRA